MSNLLSGLEKFGLDNMEMTNLFEDESKQTVVNEAGEQVEAVPTEVDFLLMKAIRCPICDKVFKTRMVKTGRAKRLEPDDDLRPRFQYIDTTKYDVSSCPNCGYTAINRYFEHVSAAQRKFIEEAVCSKFKSMPIDVNEEASAYTYDEAIERYKLALYNTIAKKGPVSEKAYECLKIAWLNRGKAEELLEQKASQEDILAVKKEELTYYTQAFDGLMKASASENFPLCGMDENTVTLLIAAMAIRLKKYDIASRYVSSIIVSQTAGRNIKNKAINMKEDIIAKLKEGK